jgi:N-methylhydantoinase A
MAAQALAEAQAEGYAAASVNRELRLDMRYAGQSHELTISCPQMSAPPGELRAAFHAAHRQRYGYDQPAAPVEIVNARLSAVVPLPPPVLPRQPLGPADASGAVIGEKLVWFGARPLTAKLYQREKLRPGNQFTGPAVIFQYDTTTVIPGGWGAAVDGYGNLILQAA